MATFRTGDMFSILHDEPMLVTTNSSIKRDGSLVMGKGAALALALSMPDIPKLFGDIINTTCGHLGEYNVLYIPHRKVGALQVKYHFSDPADAGLISRSCTYLNTLTTGWPSAHINFPGIGNGRLLRQDIEPLLSILHDNITVWTWR